MRRIERDDDVGHAEHPKIALHPNRNDVRELKCALRWTVFRISSDIPRRRLDEGGPAETTGSADELPFLVRLQGHSHLLGPAQQDEPQTQAVFPWVHIKHPHLLVSDPAHGVVVEKDCEIPMRPKEANK
jgi:hypothetical protein